MRKVINGKRYDTETATRIASRWEGDGLGDARFISEDLYRTPRGAWFIHGQGGALSMYGVPVGNAWSSGERIRTLSPEGAMEWLESHDHLGALEKYFGDTLEDA